MSDLISRLANAAADGLGAAVGRAARAAEERNLLYFPFLSQALAGVPFWFGWKLRRAAYAQILPRMGQGTIVHQGVVFDDSQSRIGDDVWISFGAYIELADIGNHVLIGPHAVLLAGAQYHRYDRIDVPIKQQGNLPRVPLRVGDGAWIGANATVMADVGHDAIVGAGAVVTKPVPPFAIVAGNPARVVRMRNAPRAADEHG